GDLTNAPDLLDLADRLVDVSVTALQAAEPLLNEMNSPDSSLDPAGLTSLLVDAQPELLKIREEFDLALGARNQVQVEQLSPRLQGLLMDELDPLLGLMDDGLTLSTALPVVLGADGNGRKSYLILVQNEDELRPTGGFITTVGKSVLQNGRIISLDFEGVDDREDWTRPYPAAPWQLQEYMNAEVLILRDSNWFADFPTSALWAEYLYSFDDPRPLDGVIAFDQQFLVMLLGVLGPLEVEGAPYAITSENAVEYMRSAKDPPAGETAPDGWYRKEFIGNIADAILDELVGGRNNDWRRLAVVMVQALEERHLLLQFDDPMVASLLAKNDWDNAVRPFDGDFLMTVDSNIGFNKTNALVDVSLSYDVNLTELSTPTGSLIVTHQNHSSEDVQCLHFDEGQAPEDYYYPMDRCYWNYLRVYKQSGVELVDASPHEIPAEWIILGRTVPARVDLLDEEIDGVQGFGTLLVVPGGQSLSTGFEFSLPASVISHAEGSDRFTYRLKVQKQPGRLADPLVIRIHLPNRSQVETVNLEALVQGDDLLIETDLRTDVYLEVVFHVQ
ncbi:MAG: DUF4012 domain-containing protein, partial [Anaerolineaceae bacterium]|nr:DUF4012 domain-containing protein [Anaerolineaceae bacterium]